MIRDGIDALVVGYSDAYGLQRGMPMKNFRRTLACFFVFAALLNLIANGWRSISWMAWLLMALGLFAISQVVDGRKSERSKWPTVTDKRNWHSPTYVVGFAAYLLGSGFLLYGAIYHH